MGPFWHKVCIYRIYTPLCLLVSPPLLHGPVAADIFGDNPCRQLNRGESTQNHHPLKRKEKRVKAKNTRWGSGPGVKLIIPLVKDSLY